jgi:hypothetical protein
MPFYAASLEAQRNGYGQRGAACHYGYAEKVAKVGCRARHRRSNDRSGLIGEAQRCADWQELRRRNPFAQD